MTLDELKNLADDIHLYLNPKGISCDCYIYTDGIYALKVITNEWEFYFTRDVSCTQILDDIKLKVEARN
jgi:hypothetical protein